MADGPEVDPFRWSEDRLVQELCTPDRTWNPPPAKKLPDLVSLEKNLRDHELEGEDLLTYEDEFGQGSFETLCKDLGLIKIPHKGFLRKAIQNFQSRSLEYLRWKELRTQGDRKEGEEPGAQGELVQPVPDLPATTTREEGLPDATTEPTAKRRKRIAPFSVEKFDSRNPHFVSVRENSYLGPQRLPDFEYFGEGSLEDLADGRVVSKKPPRGHQIQLARYMRRYLQPCAPKVGIGRYGPRRPIRDDLLPIFGDSDLENDSEREGGLNASADISEDEGSFEVTQNPRFIDKGTVHSTIETAIEDIETYWRSEKLPKLQRKANQAWIDARAQGTREKQAMAAASQVKHLEARIAKYCEGLKDSQWTTEKELYDQTFMILEVSVYDKMEEAWKTSMLNSPTEPRRIKRSHVSPKQKISKPTQALEEDEEEINTSESEPDLADFIEDDQAKIPDAMDVDDRPRPRTNFARRFLSPSTSSDDGIERLDLTQIDDSSEDDDRMDQDELDADNRLGPAAQNGNVTSPTPGDGSAVEQTDDELPFSDPEAIAKMGLDHWRRKKDNHRILITLLWGTDATQLGRLFEYMADSDPDKLWQKFCARAIRTRCRDGGLEPESPNTLLNDLAFMFIRFFTAFTDGSCHRAGKLRPLSEVTVNQLKSNRSRIADFQRFMREMIQYFPESQPFVLSATPKVDRPDDEDSDSSASDHAIASPCPSKKRGRKTVRRDKAAKDMRKNDLLRIKEQEERRIALRGRLAESNAVSIGTTRLIINESKQDEHEFIYVNDAIASRIKDHQIDGVRFLWDRIVDSENPQGCLLAHTMGLGKTMQVITLLVAIAQTATSSDPKMFSQIPLNLRESKTLVLCPAGLVNNWRDEFLQWTPSNLLGEFRVLDSQLSDDSRKRVIKNWAFEGGVLIIGYSLFRKIIDMVECRTLLNESPNIVIADEAHHLKNRNSRIHQATADFATKTRIALTGSPLANSVDEYHSMIDWLAPNYLGPHREFTAIFSTPIKDGLYADSNPYAKRLSRTRLKALKDMVAPKVHRVTMTALKSQLPEKHEFIIYLSITDFQKPAYECLVHFARNSDALRAQNMIQLFKLLFFLTLLLAHPKVFQAKLRSVRNEMDHPKPKRSEKKEYKEMLPRQVIDDLLQCVNDRQRIEDIKYSAKIIVLRKILDEAKRQGDKVLIFSQSRDTLDYLENQFKVEKRLFSRLDGDTTVHTRPNVVRNFNTGNDEIYLISTKAGGVGLNITGANRVVIFDFKWNPVDEQQAVGRAFRIGQTKPVFVYWLVVGGTYEVILQNQAVFKTQLASRVVDKKNPAAWSQSIRQYTAPPKFCELDQESLDASRLKGDQLLNNVLDADTDHFIRKIITTDTFEEEEPEMSLTQAELQEAERMVKDNQLRITDPEKWAGDQQRRSALLMSEQHREQLLLFQQSASRPAASFPSLQSAANRSMQGPAPISFATGPKLGNESAAIGVQRMEWQPAQSTVAHPDSSYVPGNGGPAVPSQPTQSHQVSLPTGNSPYNPLTANGQPVETRNVAEKSAEPLANPPVNQVTCITQLQSLEQMTRGEFRDALRTQLYSKVDYFAQGNTSIEDIENRTVAAVTTALGIDLPMVPRWKKITAHITESAKFAKAVVFKYLRPDDLALATDKQLLIQINKIETIPDEEFDKVVSERRVQPQNHSYTPTITPQRRSEDRKPEGRFASGGAKSKTKLGNTPQWRRPAVVSNQRSTPGGSQGSPRHGDRVDDPVVIDD